MNLKILFATFGLVFIAELGDKTQLTALAFSASSRSPWSVFLGTSLALVTSAAIAVLFGQVLARAVPEKVLHIGSGVMFVLIGLLLLVNVARKAPATPVAGPGDAAVSAGVSRGALSAFVLKQATRFEEDLVNELAEHARELPAGRVREATERVAEAHRTHIESLADTAHALGTNGGPRANEADEDGSDATKILAILDRPIAEPGGTEVEILAKAVKKQEAAAEFYLALARIAHLQPVQKAFRWLATEELQQAQQLATVLESEGADEA